MEFHEKLQQLRKGKRLTHEELAEALYVSRTAVSKWESGRGHPNLDSLKGIAKFFSVSVDELLSGDEMLTIAEEDQKQRTSHFMDLVYGLMDVGIGAFFFLPFFGQKLEGAVQGSSLLSLTGIGGYLKAAYMICVIGTILLGIVTLALQNHTGRFWLRHKQTLSLLMSAASLLLFIVSLQAYAAVFVFLFLAIKVILLIKKQ